MEEPATPTLPRLTLRYLVATAFKRFFNSEQGWLRTVRELFKAPGAMIRTYLTADRRSYANPVGYLMLGTAANILAQRATGFHDRIMETVRGSDGGSPGQLEFADQLVGLVQQNMLYVSFAILIPFALLLRLFFRREGLNLAELFVFVFFVGGQAALISLVVMPLLVLTPVSPHVLGLVGWLINLIYASYAAIGFFGGRVGTVVKTCLAYTLGFAAYLLVFVFAALVYLIGFNQKMVRTDSWNLVTTAEANLLEKARDLLDDGVDVDLIQARTPLHAAAAEGHMEMVDLLLEHGADVGARDHQGRVPMAVALSTRQEEIAWRLARSGTDASALDREGRSLLMYRGLADKALIRWLLENGANPNAHLPEEREATALISAAIRGQEERVVLLLEHGADPSLKNVDGQTAAELAASPEIRQLLVSHGAGIDRTDRSLSGFRTAKIR